MPKGRRKGALPGLTQREQEFLTLLYQHGPCSARQLQDLHTDDLSNATVRTVLRTLESKKRVTHQMDGNAYIYMPSEAPETAAKTALNRLVDTYFSGSSMDAVATLLHDKAQDLDRKELDELAQMIANARQEADQS